MFFDSLGSRRALLTALSLNLVTIAGCAAPTAAPVPVTTPVEAAAASGAPAAGLMAEAPATAPASTAQSLSGRVTFGGAAQTGFAVTAYDALTGQALGVTGQVVTDVKGAFAVQVTGLQAGRPVRLAATQGIVRIEGTFPALAEAVTLNESTSLLSLVQEGPLKAAGLINGDGGLAVASDYMKAAADLSGPVATQLMLLNGTAGRVVRPATNAKEQAELESAVEMIIANTGRAAALNTATLNLVQAVAAGPHANQFATFSVQATAMTYVRFLGTPFKFGVGGEGGALSFANIRTGKAVDPRTAGAAIQAVGAAVKRGRRMSYTGPFTPVFLAKYTNAAQGVPVFAMKPLAGQVSSSNVAIQLACFTSGVESGRVYVDFNLLTQTKSQDYVASVVQGLRGATSLPTSMKLLALQSDDYVPALRLYITAKGEVESIRIARTLNVMGNPVSTTLHEFQAIAPHDGLLLESIPAYIFNYQPTTPDGYAPFLGSQNVQAGFGVDDEGILAMVNGIDRLLPAIAGDDVGAGNLVFMPVFDPEDECPYESIEYQLNRGVAMRADYVVALLAGSKTANANLNVVAKWLDFAGLDAPAEDLGDTSDGDDPNDGADEGDGGSGGESGALGIDAEVE